MSQTISHPSGIDLRSTWPERQLLLRERNFRQGLYSLAEAEIPPLPEFIRACGGKMPDSFHSMLYSEYIKKLEALWNNAHQKKGLAYDTAKLVLESDARTAYHVEWWQYEGQRVYVLDPTTAFAIMHTKLDNFPTREFHLPVRSFFIRIPKELGWTFKLNDKMSLTVPLAQHPEPEQELEGFHVTADMRTDELLRLQLVCAGRSVRDLAGDHTLWMELLISKHATLGEVINQPLEPNDPEVSRGMEPEERMFQLVLGTILYITSAHPELKAVAPPAPGTRAKAKHKDPAVVSRMSERSRYAITYVGGPQYGVRQESGSKEVDALTRRPPAPHIRTGHWRWQVFGPKDSGNRRHIWIQPIAVGAWDRIAAYEAFEGMRIQIRKTRPAVQDVNQQREEEAS